jgi:hypothetical protein
MEALNNLAGKFQGPIYWVCRWFATISICREGMGELEGSYASID